MAKRELETSDCSIRDISLLEPVESNHTIVTSALKLLEEDGNLCPGLNCCAVCSKKPDSPSETVHCSECKQVLYCCKEHLHQDDAVHSRVCSTLQYIEMLRKLETPDGVTNADVAQITRNASGMDVMRDWTDVACDSLQCLYSSSTATRIKRARVSCTEDAAGEDDTTSSEQLTAQLIAATHRLSHAFSALHALQSCTPFQAAVACARSAARPVVLCVTGKLGQHFWEGLDHWRVLDSACPTGTYLHVISPDVPAQRHRTLYSVSQNVLAACWRGSVHTFHQHVARGEQLPAEFKAAHDGLISFNMNECCSEKDWALLLTSLRKGLQQRVEGCSSTAPVQQQSARLPWLAVANTQVELMMEDKLITDSGWRLVSEVDVNHFRSLATQQSPVFGNDLFRANNWCAAYELVHTSGTGQKQSSRLGWLWQSARRVLRRPAQAQGNQQQPPGGGS